VGKLPIRALLLDFQMPKKNGLHVVSEVKELYEKRNKDLNEADKYQLPTFVFMSGFTENC
jgi:CheY-like chemotaxis protein